ncbi:MAG TPA: hypothetical protein DDZ88_19755 [Verrucomicrobiales bacterium]|nr:hypothetical protein [Verrucomicrobiales bacterium]
MQSSDTEPQPPFPRPKISLVDLKHAPRHWTDEAKNKHMADQLGMTVAEMRRYLDSLPKR